MEANLQKLLCSSTGSVWELMMGVDVQKVLIITHILFNDN
jgi:hypothetical protein